MGHIVTVDGIEVDLAMVKVILNWKTPMNVNKVRSFLGLADYYRRFIQDFSRIARPLTQLTKKNEKIHWTEECDNNFKEIKQRLVSVPILTIPDGLEGFVIYTITSKNGLGYVLIQHKKSSPMR